MSPDSCENLYRTIISVGRNNERHAMHVSVSDERVAPLLKDLKAKAKTQVDETSNVLRHFEVVAIHCINGWVLNRESTRREDLKKLSLLKVECKRVME